MRKRPIKRSELREALVAANVIGIQVHARQTDGEGFLILEITGLPDGGQFPAKVIATNLSESDAIVQCMIHNDGRLK